QFAKNCAPPAISVYANGKSTTTTPQVCSGGVSTAQHFSAVFPRQVARLRAIRQPRLAVGKVTVKVASKRPSSCSGVSVSKVWPLMRVSRWTFGRTTAGSGLRRQRSHQERPVPLFADDHGGASRRPRTQRRF